MKNDAGFVASEKMLNELEAKIHKEYEQASKEMADKTTAYFNRFKAKDEEKREQYENGQISKKEYTEWRQRQMATGKRYIAMRDTLAKDLTKTDKIAMKYVNQALPDVYALNMNYGTYQIEKDSKINTSFTLYNHAAVERLIKDNPQLLPSPKVDIPKDLRWNQQHIQSAITQGILQGKSIPDIAKNLQRVTGMDENAAIRNARTAMTGAQNAGRLDSMKRAAARGIGVKKGWLATLDHVTRDSHVDLDGEVVELDKMFSNGLMYPGDASGRPEEVYNCRCRLTHEYDKYKTDWSNPANRNTEKLGNMSYQEWKNKHKQANAAKDIVKIKAAFKPKEPDKNYLYVDNYIKQSYNIPYKEVEYLDKELSEEEIIEKIGGGDLTSGSCSSLTYCYIGNKCGYDVTDFRGGQSQDCFSHRLITDKINEMEGIKSETYMLKKEASDAAKKLKELDLEKGKEYRLSVGKHAAIIRNTEHGYEYLELQSADNNGWHPFEYSRKYTFLGEERETKYTMEQTLRNRFGCRKTVDKSKWSGTVYEKRMMITEVDSFKGNEDFKDLLGYMNTAPDKQKKGASGHER